MSISNGDVLDVLSEAISDVGYWRWWSAHFPEFFQIEFGGTQLWNPPEQEGKPPSGLIALRFTDPVSVSFLIYQGAPDEFAEDWPELLQTDSIKPLTITHGPFGFNDPRLIEEVLLGSKLVDTRFGARVGSAEFADANVSLAFRTGPVGLIVAAHDLRLLNLQGEIRPDEIEQKYTQWWEYWKDYWRLIDTDKALPEDYTCEVTIPAGE